MIENLDDKTSRELLGKKRTGHLGCVLPSGEPYVVPVNYLFEDDRIYIHSLPGEKISAMRDNPRVCVQTEEIADDGFEWQSVIAFGEFREITDRKEKIRILSEFFDKFPLFTPVEARFEEEDFDADLVIFCVEINRLSGVAESY